MHVLFPSFNPLLFLEMLCVVVVSSSKATAILRLRQVVQNLWPRAQVKVFGSYVTGLSLPSSDLDLVICLPKVCLELKCITDNVIFVLT